MRARSAYLAAATAFALAPIPHAEAAIYTWIDAKGNVNVSNLKPPDGVRVTAIVPDAPARSTTSSTDAQVQALNQRVRQLEDELQAAARLAALPPPPPPPAVVPPIVQNVTVVMPAPVEPASVPEPVDAWGCGLSWPGCSSWWGAPFYPAPIVVQSGPSRHPKPGMRAPVPHFADRGARWAMIRPLMP